jgi:hypothetical protein
MGSKLTDKQYVSAAIRLFNEEGTIEIDADAKVSRCYGGTEVNEEDGAYVEAWVWVPDDVVEVNDA